MRTCSPLILIAGAFVSTSDPARADWPRFRGPSGNGIINEKLKLLARPTEVWTASVGEGNASLIVQDGRVYTVGDQRGRGPVLSCLDAASGKKIWDVKVDSWSADSSPILTKDKGFLLCSMEKPIVYCFQLSDGKTLWRKELAKPTGDRHYGHAGSAILWRDLVIVNVGHGHALKQDTGETVWGHPGLGGLATPTLYEEGGKTNVMIFAGKALYARDAASGRELWSIPWKTELAVNASDPIYHDGKVFLSTTYGLHAAAYDVTASPPKRLWKDHGSSFSSGILWKDHVLHFGGSALSCCELATGAKKWTSDRVGGGSVLLIDDKIVLLSDKGQLAIAPASLENFRPVLAAQIHGGTTWTPPSYVNGRLFVRNKDGSAICLQIGE